MSGTLPKTGSSVFWPAHIRRMVRPSGRVQRLCKLIIIVAITLCAGHVRAQTDNTSSSDDQLLARWKAAKEMLTDLAPHFDEAGRLNKIDANLLRAIAMAGPIGTKGAVGLMQINAATAAKYHITNPHDPVQAIYGSARILNDALTRAEELKGAGRNIRPIDHALTTYFSDPVNPVSRPKMAAHLGYVATQYREIIDAQAKRTGAQTDLDLGSVAAIQKHIRMGGKAGLAAQMYVVGIEDGLSWANATLQAEGGKQLYCQPAELVLTSDQIMEIVTRFLGKLDLMSDEEKQKPGSVGAFLLVALQDLFPCH